MNHQNAVKLAVRLVAGPLLLWAAGCQYTPAKSPYVHQKCRLEVSLPSGWLQFVPSKEGYMITRDGLRLESILVKVTRFGKKLEGTERVYQAGMLPQEIADLSFALLKAQENAKNAVLERLDTATVAGKEGYKAEITYIDGQGLPVRLRMYGTVIGDHVCEFVFAAADPVYFSRYEQEFETLVASAKVRT